MSRPALFVRPQSGPSQHRGPTWRQGSEQREKHVVQREGTAIEVPLRVRLQVSLIKGKKTAWPRFENETSIMTVGAYRPLDDALRIAFTELVGWIHSDYGLSKLDAYELLSKVARIHLAEMVDPNYVVIAGIDKKYLPVR